MPAAIDNNYVRLVMPIELKQRVLRLAQRHETTLPALSVLAIQKHVEQMEKNPKNKG